VPIEVEISLSSKSFTLATLEPDQAIPVPNYSTGKTLLIRCDENDDGGMVIVVDNEDLDVDHEGVATVDIHEDAQNIELIDIDNSGEFRDYVGVCPGRPLILGELVARHV